jgi:hypothetical protein
MPIYRIYALIYGETLPEGKILGCEIKKMNFSEQRKRKFKPIQSTFSELNEDLSIKTYATSLRYIDPIKIKSEYVIICNIKEDKTESALGGAIRNIDQVARYLSIICVEDIKRKFGRNRGNFEPYIYQVNKIYLVNDNEKENEIDYKLKCGNIYLPNRPEQTQWRDSTTRQFSDEFFNFYDEVLDRSLKYLYRSSIGHFILDSPEKIALDHFKSIEIIVNALSNKKNFKERLKEASEKIDISGEEQIEIERFWDERSKYGDIAHPSKFDEAERYPNQFPLPSNARYSGGFCDHIAPSVIIKYFNYIKNIYYIDINEMSLYELGSIKDNFFSKVLTFFPFGVNDQNHYSFTTTEKDKNRLKSKIKKSFIEHFKISNDYKIEVNCVQNKDKYLKEKKFIIRLCTKT